MRWLVIGTGQTGRKVIECVRERHDVVGTFYSKPPGSKLGQVVRLDKTRREDLFAVFDAVRPAVVVDTATPPGMDYLETHRDETWNVNARGTQDLIECCRQYGTLLVFISTDCVFDGERGNYAETDLPHPINYYGRTKVEAEELITASLERYVILRPSLIYSWDREFLRLEQPGRNPSFAMWLIGILLQGKKVRVISDQYSSPTLADHLAQMILELVEKERYGLYHAAGATRLSRFEFACRIAEVLGLDPVLIEPAASAEFRVIAPRPRDVSLNVAKVSRELTGKPLGIDQALTVIAQQAEEVGLSTRVRGA